MYMEGCRGWQLVASKEHGYSVCEHTRLLKAASRDIRLLFGQISPTQHDSWSVLQCVLSKTVLPPSQPYDDFLRHHLDGLVVIWTCTALAARRQSRWMGGLRKSLPCILHQTPHN